MSIEKTDWNTRHKIKLENVKKFETLQCSPARFGDTPTILGVLCIAVDCLLIYIKMIINSPGSGGEREKHIPTHV